MSNDIDSLKSSFAIFNSAVNNIKVGDSVSQTSFDALKSEFYLVKAQVDLLETPTQDVTQAELDAVSAQITTINTSVTSLSDKVAALDSQMAAAQVDIAALKTAVAALQATTTPATTPPATAIAVTDAIDVTILTVTGVNLISVPVNTSPDDVIQNYFLLLHYKNTSNVAFNSVKFKISMYITGLTLNATSGIAVTTLPSNNPLWVLTYQVPNTTYYYQSLTGVIVAAHAEGELTIQLAVKYTAATAGNIFIQTSVMP